MRCPKCHKNAFIWYSSADRGGTTTSNWRCMPSLGGCRYRESRSSPTRPTTYRTPSCPDCHASMAWMQSLYDWDNCKRHVFHICHRCNRCVAPSWPEAAQQITDELRRPAPQTLDEAVGRLMGLGFSLASKA